MTTIYDLVNPKDPALLRSKKLSECIEKVIAKRNAPIPFADFMELALYHPEFGYYTNTSFTMGPHGDFTTAPEISPLFAKCFARQLLQIFAQLHTIEILELGAGTGRFAYDLLFELSKQGCIPAHYYIYEKSMALQNKQKTFLKSACPLFERIRWIDALPENFVGAIIANEVLDALPVHTFCIENNEIKERCVRFENNKFIWHYQHPSSDKLAKSALKIHDLYSLDNGYASEINLNIATLVKSLANCVSQGVMLFADYGYGQREYYHPERCKGTLTCFYQHHRHDDPLIFPGLQDITAHVDFTNVIETAVDEGFTLAGYTSQAAFLLACGLMQFASQAEKQLSPVEQFNLHQAIKLLTFPHEMGERIKIMALAKNIKISLLGFELQDRSREL